MSRRMWILVTTVGFLGPLAAHAGGWGNPVTITGSYIYNSAGGWAFITTSGNQNPDGCTSPQTLTLDSTQANFKYLWATILSAQATGQTVVLNYNGCAAQYPLVNTVAISVTSPGSW
jgi:hypothetical protein